jgi:putative acetyltransferase
VIVRAETPRDLTAIRTVHLAAFGQEAEGQLVDRLRQTGTFVPELSLVATRDGVVVGHILFSRVKIRGGRDGVSALALAPMAVLPGCQRQGIGSALVRAGLERARQLGHRVVVVLGHPEYYPRFGFAPAARWGIRTPFGAPDDAFMLLELGPGRLVEAGPGEVEYPAAFHDLEG